MLIAVGPFVFARVEPTQYDRLRTLLTMPYCARPGCSAIVPRGYCRAHAVRDNARVRRWYRIARWFRLRREVILDQASACARCGRVLFELEVDHIRRHDGDPALFWDRANLQALCPACHAAKTKHGG